jgi:hypothetical protein
VRFFVLSGSLSFLALIELLLAFQFLDNSSAPFSWTTPMRQDASGRHVKEEAQAA